MTITEGQEDAMSVYQLQGSKYPVVSLKGGTNSQLTQEDMKYCETFDHIVYCGDNDEPGRKAAQQFAANFAKNKCTIVRLSAFKDANDYLQEILRLENDGRDVEAQQLQEKFIREWWSAEAYTPDGLVQGKNTLELFITETETKSVPYPWQGLQEVLHGIRTSELVVITAGSGSGKSAVVRELAYHIFKAVPSERIGCMFLEESLKRTVKDFVGIELNVNLRFPENVVTLEQRQRSLECFI